MGCRGTNELVWPCSASRRVPPHVKVPVAREAEVRSDPLPSTTRGSLPFHPRTEAELGRLSDEELIRYLRAAHAASARDAARTALQILVYGYWNHVGFRLERKLPAHAVEDVTGDVIVRAIQSAFSGQSVGEFRSWLHTITDRTIADFYRARRRRPEEAPLETEGEEIPSKEPVAPDSRGYVEAQMVVEQVLDELRPDHRRVVEIVVFEDRPASAAAAEVDEMTTANAYQVVSRFRARVREVLEADTRAGNE
jgi:RNA polymerase sigma factor (sigma-70 family)